MQAMRPGLGRRVGTREQLNSHNGHRERRQECGATVLCYTGGTAAAVVPHWQDRLRAPGGEKDTWMIMQNRDSVLRMVGGNVGKENSMDTGGGWRKDGGFWMRPRIDTCTWTRQGEGQLEEEN